MTTIVYHEGIIAQDSLISNSEKIIDDNTNKSVKKDGVLFFWCGSQCDIDQIINAYNGGSYDKINANISAIIVDGGIVYSAAISEHRGFWKLDITGRSYAIGSGEDHAWTALDLGCNAKEAVEMAIKRDLYTGGKIRTHKVRKL